MSAAPYVSVGLALAVGAAGCFDFGGYTEGAGAATGAGGVGVPTDDGGPTGGAGGTPECAQTCVGCCDGEQCVSRADQGATQCGKDGANCASCNSGFLCGAGTCVADPGTCSSGTCDGCCSENFCYDSSLRDWYACGADGAECTSCDLDVLCSDAGACDPGHFSPTAVLRLKMGVAQVACEDCEAFGSPPDPYVCLKTREMSEPACSSHCSNIFTCDYGAGENPFVVENLMPSDLTNGTLQFAFWDSDWPDSDNILCEGILQFPAPLERTTGQYVIDPEKCLETEGTLVTGWFQLESMVP